MAVLPSGPRRLRTCNLPIKSRVLCRVELRSQVTWPAGIEPAAPCVSGRRSTGLSYDHMSRRGWDRTSDLLFVRQALVPTELLALEWTGRESNPRTTALLPQLPLRRGCFAELSAIRPTDPGQGIEPRPPGSEPGVLPVRRSRSSLRAGATARQAPAGDFPSTPPAWSRRKVILSYVSPRSCRDDVFQATRPTLRPWIDTFGLARAVVPSFVEELWSPVRALPAKKALVNQGAKCACPFLRESARDLLSLKRGLNSI